MSNRGKVPKVGNRNSPKALHCHATFSVYNFLFSWCNLMVLEWDFDKLLLFTRGSFCSKYFQWYITVFVCAVLMGFGSCSYIIINSKTLPAQLVCAAYLISAVIILLCGLATVAGFYPNELTKGINNLTLLKRQLDDDGFFRTISGNKKLETYWKWTSRGVQLMIISFAGISVVLPMAAVVMSIDPFFCTFPLLFPTSQKCVNSPICNLLRGAAIVLSRLAVAYICCIEVTRFFSFFFSTLVYMFEVQMRYLNILHNFPLGSRMDGKFLKWYNSYRVADQSFKEPFSLVVFILLGDGFVIFVVANVMTIKTYYILPIEVYWICPMVSLMTAFFVYIFLPLAIMNDKETKQLIWRRTSNLNRGGDGLALWERKLVRRKLRSLRPVAFQCGTVFTLSYGVDLRFIGAILIRTCDGLILI
ncbi:unnamed protein product [Orchesella dallaii]|uniref:Gustatory receptor n=1 Tax=Orchesella dallaii TaxID=48710 RepID=A0ABP1RTP6_9HEXA